VLVLLAGACAVPIAGGLDESDANEAVVALEKQGVVAQKEPDPEREGRWRISVPRDEATSAVAVLTRESLPPRSAPGVLDALGEGSIVPSRLAEHAKLVTGTAGDLERSLRAVEGVLSARVHLAIPPKDALTNGDHAPEPTASVLLRHRGTQLPIAAVDVQRLVAGAVPGLSPEHVSVVATTSPAPPRGHERNLTRFGPVTVTRSSILALRLVVAGALLLNLILIGCVLLLWSRVKKTQLALADSRSSRSEG
jgi:type III secretion protein J